MKSNLQSVYGLAFVPVDDVSVGWTCIKSLLTQYPATAAFITYFESTWLNNTAYPIRMWNHYDSTLSDDPRTNNFSEGSNNALNTALLVELLEPKYSSSHGYLAEIQRRS